MNTGNAKELGLGANKIEPKDIIKRHTYNYKEVPQDWNMEIIMPLQKRGDVKTIEEHTEEDTDEDIRRNNRERRGTGSLLYL